MDVIDALDEPVLKAIRYFTGIMNYFLSTGTKMGLFFGIVGLAWSAFKTINGRMQIKELWWDTIYKWIVYILLMSCWVPLTKGIATSANSISAKASAGQINLSSNINSIKSKIQQLSYDEKTNLAMKMQLIATSLNYDDDTQINSYSGGSLENYTDYLISMIQTANNNNKKKNEKIKELREKLAEVDTLSSTKTLEALRELIGDKGDLDTYVSTNLKLTGDGGYGFLSAASLFRFGTMICSLLWLQNEIVYNQNLANIEEEYMQKNSSGLEKIGDAFSKGMDQIGAFGSFLLNSLICMILCFFVILSCCFSIIQYVMTCLEFVIISGIGIFYVPFILFDGTKELPKKFVPVFISLFTKLLVITLCLFYVMWTYLNMANGILGGSNGMNWFNVGCVILQILIGLVLTQNAPKIATTITTGQAQLSMGELVAAAGTMYGAAKAGKMAYGKAAQTKGAIQAGNAARKIVKENGGNRFEQMKAGAMAAHSTFVPNGFTAQHLKAQSTGASIGNSVKVSPPPQQREFGNSSEISSNITNVTNTTNKNKIEKSSKSTGNDTPKPKLESNLNNIKLSEKPDA